MPGYYATDLQLVGAGADGDATFALVEATAYAGGSLVSTSAPDTDSFIQGVASMTGLSSKSANTGMSLFYNRGSTLSVTGGNILNLWTIYATPSALDVFAATNGSGTMVIVGTSATNINSYRVDGSNTLSYGGWKNYIVDLRNTPTGPNNTSGSATTVQYFGTAFRQIAAFKAAVPLALDAIRYGRQILSAIQGTSTTVNHTTPLTSTAANFPQMAYYNDYNAGGTPQLSATNIGLAVDGGFHRFGSLQEVSGGYLARGILRLGTDAAAVYFNDANRNINFEDVYLSYNDFNRIEIRHASSNVQMNSISVSFIPRPAAVSAGNAPATPRCNFEMHAAATVGLTNCTFTDLGTFIFLAGGAVTVTGSTFRRCNQITPAGGTFSNCLFTASNDSTGAIILTSPGNIANMSACTFTDNAVAIKITAAGTYSFIGHQFSGNTLQVDFTGTGTCTIVPSNGSNVSQANVTASGGGTITVNAPSVNLTFTGVVSNSEVRVIRVSDNVELGGIENTSGNYVFSHALGGTIVNIYILHLNYQWLAIRNYTLLAENATIPVQQIPDRQYI
jgi:hypothetical protein